MQKNEFLGCCKYSCKYFICNRCFENIDTNITTFFQCPEHDKNSSNNCNKYSDAGSDYNSYDELLEPYILDYNDIHIN